jgi:hypothetical protein
MAVVITGTRVHETFSSRETRAFVNYLLSGTYATGGFVTPFSGVAGSPGTSPFISKNPLKFDWNSPSGYSYFSTITFSAAGIPTVTTKIFSAPGVELANGTAVPDAAIQAAIDMQKY